MERCATMAGRGVDGRVIEACRQGDREAFRLLFDAYKDKVYSIALHFLHGDTATAEDITQEVFLKLFTRIGQYRSDAEFATWLYRFVVNVCLDEHRRRRRLTPLGDTVELMESQDQDGPAEAFARQEVAESVQAALADLSPEV